MNNHQKLTCEQEKQLRKMMQNWLNTIEDPRTPGGLAEGLSMAYEDLDQILSDNT